jgi:hypothetical protein
MKPLQRAGVEVDVHAAGQLAGPEPSLPGEITHREPSVESSAGPLHGGGEPSELSGSAGGK